MRQELIETNNLSLQKSSSVERKDLIEQLWIIYNNINILDLYFKNRRRLLIFKNKNVFTIYLPMFLSAFVGTQTFSIIEAAEYNLSFNITLTASIVFNILIGTILFWSARYAFNAWFGKVELKIGYPLFDDIPSLYESSTKIFTARLIQEKNDCFFKLCSEKEVAEESLAMCVEIWNREEYYHYLKNCSMGFRGFFGITMLGLSIMAGWGCGFAVFYILHF